MTVPPWLSDLNTVALGNLVLVYPPPLRYVVWGRCLECPDVLPDLYYHSRLAVLGPPRKRGAPCPLKAAWDCDINTIDTANMYSNGASEKIVGKFLQTVALVVNLRGRDTENNIPRHNFVIITKARFIVAHNDPSAMFGSGEALLMSKREYVNQGGLSRAALFNQVEASLERLNTTYIGGLIIHSGDPDIDEMMKALHDLVQSGKVRYIGASNIHLWKFAEMNNVTEKNNWTTFSCVQIEHFLIYRSEAEPEMFAYCNSKGIGILAYSPLMDGHLARPVGIETEKVALAWSLTKVSSPVVGMSSVERVHQAIIPEEVLTADEIKYLEEP
ncbi:Aldo/keto reductase [Mycena latifolia]|nr:Aldo/keto reductase [Mycena latifolia]